MDNIKRENLLKTYADLADFAMVNGSLIPPVKEVIDDFTVKEAYALQYENSEKRMHDDWNVAGYKIGATTFVAQKKMDTLVPVYGLLYDKMVLQSDSAIETSKLNYPLLEVEIALIVSNPVTEPIYSAKEALAHIQEGKIAFEVASNRLNAPAPNAASLIADGTAARYIVLGDGSVSGDDILGLKDKNVQLYDGNILLEDAKISEIYGNPLRSFVWLANMLLAQRKNLKRGDIVMTGSATHAIPIVTGKTFTAESENLKKVVVNFL